MSDKWENYVIRNSEHFMTCREDDICGGYSGFANISEVDQIPKTIL